MRILPSAKNRDIEISDSCFNGCICKPAANPQTITDSFRREKIISDKNKICEIWRWDVAKTEGQARESIPSTHEWPLAALENSDWSSVFWWWCLLYLLFVKHIKLYTIVNPSDERWDRQTDRQRDRYCRATKRAWQAIELPRYFLGPIKKEFLHFKRETLLPGWRAKLNPCSVPHCLSIGISHPHPHVSNPGSHK